MEPFCLLFQTSLFYANTELRSDSLQLRYIVLLSWIIMSCAPHSPLLSFQSCIALLDTILHLFNMSSIEYYSRKGLAQILSFFLNMPRKIMFVSFKIVCFSVALPVQLSWTKSLWLSLQKVLWPMKMPGCILTLQNSSMILYTVRPGRIFSLPKYISTFFKLIVSETVKNTKVEINLFFVLIIFIVTR